MALDHSCQAQRHTNEERGLDHYDTPPEALHALLKVLPLPTSTRIWEPCAGTGNLVQVLRARGHRVVASDIADRGCPDCYLTDFFTVRELSLDCEVILTNPPYRWVEKFVRHALELKPKLLILLLRLAFYESERRCDILENCGLMHVFQFRKRLPMMHRATWNGKKANSGMAFAWYIWKPDYTGLTTISRISWER